MVTACRYPRETDLWMRSRGILAQKMVPYSPPAHEGPVMPASTADGAGGSGAALGTNCYVLTGATGGLGGEVLRWLVEDQGIDPQQVVVLSRRKVELGFPVRVVLVDISDEKAMLACEELKCLQQVVGIFHLAGALNDGTIPTMTEEKMAAVQGPKSVAAANLLACAAEFEWHPQWLLGFSSTSSLLGYPGQANYCAANQVLDNMAAFGTGADGPRVVAINWGPWGEVGMARPGTKAYDIALKDGDRPLATATGLACLEAVILAIQEEPPVTCQFAVCDVDWGRSRHWGDLAMVELLTRGSATPSTATPSPRATSLSPVAAFFAEQLDTEWTTLASSTMAAAGLDSLDIVTTRNIFSKKFKPAPLGLFTKPNVTFEQLERALENYAN